jgi:hypothetical protein
VFALDGAGVFDGMKDVEAPLLEDGDDDDDPADVVPAALDEPDDEELEDVEDVALMVLAICFNSGKPRLRS